MKIHDKPVAWVTGASQGLGAHFARRLVEKGFALALHYRSNRLGAERLARELSEMNSADLLLVSGDLSQPGVAEKILQSIDERWHRLDVLISNQGTYRPVPLGMVTPEQWQEGLDSTVTSTFLTLQAVVPFMRKTAREAEPKFACRILVLGDSSCDRATARDLALSYHIGKTGVLMLSKSFAQAEAASGITVNCLSPGYFENSVDLPPASTLPAKTYVTLEDVWQAADFLMRPESQAITGTNLVVSGGWNLR